MFCKNIYLLILVILVGVSAQNLLFDVQSIKYTKAADFWTCEVPVIGGSGQYTYEYVLPTGWSFTGNQIKLPTSATTKVGSEYTVRCRVRDTTQGSTLERSLVFKPVLSGTVYSFSVVDREYFYGSTSLTTYSQQVSQISGLNILSQLNSLISNFNSFNLDSILSGSSTTTTSGSTTTTTITSGSGSLTTSTGMIDLGSFFGSIDLGSWGTGSLGSFGTTTFPTISFTNNFGTLPTIFQLEKLINAGDIISIIKVIQLVTDSSIKCEAKVSYLSDFLGRINAGLQIKKTTLKQLQELAASAVAQVSKLTLQLQTIKSQQALLKVDQLKIQLDNLIIKLKAAYEEYNRFSVSTTTLETEIITYEREITQINIKYTEIVNSITIWKQTITAIDLEIAQYEEKIRLLRERKVTIQTQITTGQTFINERQVKINQLREKITIARTKITEILTTKENLKKAYLALEVTVNSAKLAYESALVQFNQYQQQIITITAQIAKYQKLTYAVEIKQITQIIENLESAIKDIKAGIEFIQFKCFNAPDVIYVPPSLCYNIPQLQWISYINKCYTNLAEQIRLRFTQIFTSQIVQVTCLNIFSSSWIQAYGSSFQKDILLKAQNYKTDLSLGFSSDFSCSNEFVSIETKTGVITGITSNSISVKGDDGVTYTLRLGSCSRIEGPGIGFIPKVGNNIIFKGLRNVNLFNLHSCTCY